jgi:hypothetical protein
MTQPTGPAGPQPTPWYAFMTNLQAVAQFGHFFGGLSIVLLLGVFFGLVGLWGAFAVGLVYAIGKEFWFDIRYERDSWSNSIMDFTFYVLGGGAAVGLFYLALHLGRLVG